jgi:hypothetical protein
MSELSTPPHGTALGRTWPIIWLIFLSLLFTFGWYKWSLNQRDQRALSEWKMKHDELTERSQTEWKDRVARIRALQLQADSKRQLELELNGGEPFDLKANGSYQSFDWSHPEYGGELTLNFENGVLVGHRARWGTGDPERLHPRPVRQALTGRNETWRRALIRPSLGIWLGAFVAMLVFRNLRLIFAQVMLAAGLVFGTSCLVNPHYSISWQGVFSNDYLFYALLMIALGVISVAQVLAISQASARPRYSLRWLFFAMTATALILATGPFGIVAVSVAAFSLFLGVAVYALVRSKLPASA